MLDLGAGQVVVSTDTFVVSPLEFPGGNIGSLAVHGTLNDLAMMGGRPRYLTAGFVLDLRKDPRVGKAILFFRGSDFPERDPRGGFDNVASLGPAWSDDLTEWSWPGKASAAEGEK